ncbi:MAG TPA: type IV secretion system DNA-binding domain-containing protein [Candidatus Paceibacterota bacterium]|nr:type IV secretion system DNA-binding domain-containing protein [Candidatus Paceibacterota bacterium]
MENPERVTYFAATDSRGKYIPFGIKSKDRDRHMYVIGKTGMGKSTLLENMAIQDIRNGEGFAFIDPHGGTVDHILDFIPEERIKDVVYFAPFDMEHPIAFNVMEDVGYDKRHLVVSGLMATFKKIWEDAWSARMEYILTNTLLALLEYPDATLLGVNRMYTDKLYRQKVVDNVKDPVVKDFWTKEFANYGDRYTQEATPAIQNKIGQFTGNPLIRNIIGQSKSSFDIRTMMDEKKILIINLSKGLVGETNMRLIGSMLTTRIFLGAMSRADLPAAELAKLPNFYFYVDEFQNFANETFAEILSEARKYKLNLVIAHQYIEQMEEEVRDAVFGNVGTTVVFRVGPFDAEVLETIFLPKFTKEDVVTLDKRQIYLTLMIDGVGSAPFSAVTIPPIEAPAVSHREAIIASSREQFTTPRAGIENAIMEELTASAAAPAPFDARMKKKPVSQAPVQTRPPTQTQTPPPMPRPAPIPSTPVLPAAPAPTPPVDLKAILRSMTTKTSGEREQKQTENKQSLKGALAEVLEKNKQKTENSKQEIPKSAPNPRPTNFPTPHGTPTGIPETQSGFPVQEKKQEPFEVSEDTLRKVFKGET